MPSGLCFSHKRVWWSEQVYPPSYGQTSSQTRHALFVLPQLFTIAMPIKCGRCAATAHLTSLLLLDNCRQQDATYGPQNFCNRSGLSPCAVCAICIALNLAEPLPSTTLPSCSCILQATGLPLLTLLYVHDQAMLKMITVLPHLAQWNSKCSKNVSWNLHQNNRLLSNINSAPEHGLQHVGHAVAWLS